MITLEIKGKHTPQPLKRMEDFTEVAIGETISFEINSLTRMFKLGEEIRFAPLSIDIGLLHRVLFNEEHMKWAEELWEVYYYFIITQYQYRVDTYETRARMSDDMQRLFKVTDNLSSSYQIIDNKARLRIEKTKTGFLINIDYKVMPL